MSWIRKHWLVLVFLAALIAAPLATHHDSVRQARVQSDSVRATQVIGCESSSTRTAIIADGWHRLSVRVAERGNPGDRESAANYQGTADALINEIPAPAGFAGSPVLAQVDKAPSLPGEGVRFRLSPDAKHLQALGCMARYDR